MPGSGPRLTVRGLMAVVAVVGVMLGGGLGVARARRWTLDCRARATDHALREADALRTEQRLRLAEGRLVEHARTVRQLARSFRPGSSRARRAESMVADADGQLQAHREAVASAAAWAAWHARMQLRYERAVGRPWASLGPEPPRPSRPEEVISDQVR